MTVFHEDLNSSILTVTEKRDFFKVHIFPHFKTEILTNSLFHKDTRANKMCVKRGSLTSNVVDICRSVWVSDL